MNTMPNQDHLSALFAAQMSLSPTPPPEQNQQAQPPKNIFPSAHYTPTRHMLPIRFSPPPEAPEPIPDVQVPFFLNGLATLGAWTPAQTQQLWNIDPSQRLALLKEWGHVRKDFYLPESSGAFLDGVSEHMLSSDIGAAQQQNSPFVRPASAPESRSSLEAEPYMTSGYDMLARREYDESVSVKGAYMQSTDPAWNRGAAAEDEMEF
jgi:hypothetical protein